MNRTGLVYTLGKEGYTPKEIETRRVPMVIRITRKERRVVSYRGVTILRELPPNRFGLLN